MKRFRMRVTDLNGRVGTIVIPLLDAADWGVAFEIRTRMLQSIMPAERETLLMAPIQTGAATGATGPTATVFDVAVLVFKSTGPFGLKVPMLGPGAIFLPDNVTVDRTIPSVANLIAAVLAFGCDTAGNALTACIQARRVA